MTNIKIYLVGGAVRDKLMGLKPKDLDYVMVLADFDKMTVEQGYATMKDYMEKEGFTIWLETPEMFTIRAKFPENYPFKGDADFVLARKEVGYEAGTRRPILELGTLRDDLIRRDFTVNAMAEDENGNVIDLFGSYTDLINKILVTPLPAEVTLFDDPLRLLRALRFKVTKGFNLSTDLLVAMQDEDVLDKLVNVVSAERVREELFKMLKHDTVETLKIINEYENAGISLMKVLFGRGLWLKPTFEK